MRVLGHVAAQPRDRSPLGADPLTADDLLEQDPVLRLDSFDSRSVRLDHALHSRAAGERLRRSHGGLGLDEYSDEMRAVFLGERARELQDACGLAGRIDEDYDFLELGLVGLDDQRLAAVSDGGNDQLIGHLRLLRGCS